MEAPEKVMKLTEIRLLYHVRLPAGKREVLERVAKVFEQGCPIAQTLKGCVRLVHEWDVVEE